MTPVANLFHNLTYYQKSSGIQVVSTYTACNEGRLCVDYTRFVLPTSRTRDVRKRSKVNRTRKLCLRKK
uniref:Uncharacterized protein n=1 Tax=Hyaloperonospora arabidopsidis (strain Emoy2) TaxID=559515 RepID=M4BVZ9_HYAAE